jgi:hypothetical protein
MARKTGTAAPTALEVIANTATGIIAAASGRVAEKSHVKAVQPIIDGMWAAGGQTRDQILRIADRIATECGDRKDLKNTALSILRVRASRAQKAAGDHEQGITLRSGVAQWQAPKPAKTTDYIGEALKLIAKAVEAGAISEAQAQQASTTLLTPVEVLVQAPRRLRRAA